MAYQAGIPWKPKKKTDQDTLEIKKKKSKDNLYRGVQNVKTYFPRRSSNISILYPLILDFHVTNLLG